ncbi:AraC family transcriptional regulator [Metabacillus endolithicus]|uniref:AraC family transcriptional regulator n=1 Tax=Metabacillus endolithicus TaxID=1535204 RepID=A0ABW5C3L2_9BACI|nr:AraC family transcriptional regulator [Metabacillus endolithicus]UPG62479.1 AraC family transcriptional regulator [Metabacillus endolithicus]
MNLNEYTSGKITLNQYAHRLAHNGASFYVHYWGVMPKHYDNMFHKHSFFEVCFVVDGEGEYIEEGCTYPIQKDMIFFSRPDVLHQISSKDGLSLLYVAFELIESESNEEWIKIMDDVRNCNEIIIDVNNETPALLWKSLLIQSTKSEQAFFEEMIPNLAYSLILSLVQTFSSRSFNKHQHHTPKTASSLFNIAKLYIKDNLSQPLRLTDAAGHLHISGRHLSRIFVSEVGVSYSEFVQNERIQRAATLLKTTDLSIKDISEETGFKNIHYFTRVFTSTMGISPGRFRSIYIDSKATTYTKGQVQKQVR